MDVERRKPNQLSGSLSARLRRRLLVDRAARWCFALGGVGVVFCILAIFFFIVFETLPLWRGARTGVESVLDLSALGTEPLAIGEDEYREVLYALTPQGRVEFYSLRDGGRLFARSIGLADGEEATSAHHLPGSDRYVVATSAGRVIEVEVGFDYKYDQAGSRHFKAVVRTVRSLRVADAPLTDARLVEDDEGGAAAAVTRGGGLVLVTEEVETSLFGEGERRSWTFDLTPMLKGARPTHVAIDSGVRNLYAGTADGRIFHWALVDRTAPEFMDYHQASPDRRTAVTAMGFILGGNSLAVGDASGGVSIWFLVPDETSPMGKRLVRAHVLESHKTAVTALAPSPRRRGLLSADAAGEVMLHYVTSERRLAVFSAGGRPVTALAFSPRANGAVAATGGGRVVSWRIDNPHPEVSLKALFGKVWYEGYPGPAWVWQSTGGTDEYEPKLSLTPLVFGTVKGTFYALIFAVPLGVLSALCVSQFMHRRLRAVFKPVLEMMAALPSVVLGFLAGLWLAPLIERYMPGVVVGLAVFPLLTLLSVIAWRVVPRGVRTRFRGGTELLLLVPVYALGIALCAWLNGYMELHVMGGEFRTWLMEVLGLRYDQRNALIVGFAMGFAVIPIIFTISEDALSGVPNHLVSGSLALGATRWQTAINVVLPTASPGIFSAVMLGMGRAVGETMIVLMATGNTPLMDWNPFEGFRALSANIAVELPEAPQGGTLYRVLFVSAILLFVMTFFINTLSEIVRLKLRRMYRRL